MDTLEGEPAAGLTLAITGPMGAGLVADESNLVIKAWRLLEEVAKRALPAVLRLEKRIPHGAGLGGGSSDAAAALRLGNDLFDLGFDGKVLLGLAARLGSDVPLFLLGGTVLGLGRGERVFPLRPVPLEPMLVVHSGLHISTPSVYRALQDIGYPFPEALSSQPEGKAPPWRNDLTGAALWVCPPLGDVRDALRDTGGDPLLCGSGCCWAARVRHRAGSGRGRGKTLQPSWKLAPLAPLKATLAGPRDGRCRAGVAWPYQGEEGRCVDASREGPVRRILVILGHPRRDSFCAALADAYAQGAGEAGLQVERLDLAELTFDPHVRRASPRDQILEADLAQAQALISWADHLVFVYPTWWGTMPALLKGFLDRVLVPGFAFEVREEDPSMWTQRLKGRSAHLLVTMDTPAWVYRLIYRQPGHQAMRRATLGFCGIRPTFISSFSPVQSSSPELRIGWLEQAQKEPRRLSRRLRLAGARKRAGAWLRLLRLQFYPMAWVAYTIGALAAWRHGGPLPSGLLARLLLSFSGGSPDCHQQRMVRPGHGPPQLPRRPLQRRLPSPRGEGSGSGQRSAGDDGVGPPVGPQPRRTDGCPAPSDWTWALVHAGALPDRAELHRAAAAIRLPRSRGTRRRLSRTASPPSSAAA